ncbi:hypothetical protein [Vallitalea okinawensis]|uniref:hypothetical protein n=1 Tax=Vallitalea okinawensis TaxID=2078660 RepID=UPI0013006F84|nr:hypothetical protein [Vallitalea okinawensis]
MSKSNKELAAEIVVQWIESIGTVMAKNSLDESWLEEKSICSVYNAVYDTITAKDS